MPRPPRPRTLSWVAPPRFYSTNPVDLTLIGRRGLDHRGEPRLLLRRVLGNRVERVLEHRLVVRAHRTHVGAAPAAGDHARPAQDALPQVEAVLRAQQRLLARVVGLVDDAAEVLGELGEAVGRAVAVAGLPVAVPLLDHVARAGLEA